jgi:hypothetical protein
MLMKKADTEAKQTSREQVEEKNKRTLKQTPIKM